MMGWNWCVAIPCGLSDNQFLLPLLHTLTAEILTREDSLLTGATITGKLDAYTVRAITDPTSNMHVLIYRDHLLMYQFPNLFILCPVQNLHYPYLQ